MTKQQFLDQLETGLKQQNIPDASDILEEYRQHFDFRLADGYSEEEIAARLGNPMALASQFTDASPSRRGCRSALTVAGLCVAHLFAGCFFALLAAWEAVMTGISLSCAILAVCLLGNLPIARLIPPMPYWCGAVLGIAAGALAVLAAIGCIYFFAFLRQLARSYGRFRHNTLAAASGRPVLPSLAIHPRFAPKTARRLRTATLVTLALFGASFLLGLGACVLSAGALEFWHAWGWFGYMAT